MKCLLRFAVLAVISNVVYGDKTLPKDSFLLDQPDDVLFQEFQKKFDVSFAKSSEKIQRFNIFSKNLVKIRALNAMNNGAKFGINAFSDLSPEEFKQRLLSDEFMFPSNVQNATDEDVNIRRDWREQEHQRTRRDVYPTNFDWRTQNVVSPIRDQGSCGSCWAFASVAAVEAHYAIKNNGAKIELSEQELVDCDKRSYGCNGGYMYEALEYIRDKGLHSQTNYPYSGWGNGCQSNKTGTKTKIADALYILPNNEIEVRNFIFNKGPAIMGFVFPYSLQYYVSGIFSLTWEECRSQRNGNHAMTIVGYGEENGKKFWLAKNSWGTWWGENGYIRFERDIEFCGMVSNFYLFAPSFDAPTTTTSSTTTTTTTTTPVPTTTTTVQPQPFIPLNCSGAMDLVFLIDVSETMTEERLNIVKSQLISAITQNGIKWESTDNNTARVGIILSAGLFSTERAMPRRFLDFQGHQTDIYRSPKIVSRTHHLKQAFRDIIFDFGINDIGLSMNFSINGDSDGDFPFGDPIFGGEGDRPNVPNAMIVITGADTSNASLPSTLLKNSNVQVYAIGFQDVSNAQLQAISGDPTRAFSSSPENLANDITNICATTTTTTPVPTTTTTVQPQPFIPLKCSGAMDLVFLIDVSETMTEERLNIVKSQLISAITQNGIKWESTDNNTARVGIILSAGLFSTERAMPRRFLDFQGHQTDIYRSPKIVSRTHHLKQAFRDIIFDFGINDIGLSMNFSINGDSDGDFPFGDPIFGGEGDRPNVPNAMIVITGADTSNATVPSTLLKNSNVQVYAIGFQDVSNAQLQAISGDPTRAFSSSPENLANDITNICATTTTTTPVPTPVPTTTTTVQPQPYVPLNCSGAMDLVFLIDVSETMTEERLNIVKSQLISAITQNGIKWESTDNNTARVGIILSAGLFSTERAMPRRFLDFQGHQTDIYRSPKIVSRTHHLKQAFRDIIFDFGINDIGLSMNFSINGDSVGDFPFGDPIFGGEGDRPNVPNAMIVITGADTSNATVPSTLLKNSNVQVYAIGFQDVSIAQLQAISGDPTRAFSSSPENLANDITNICNGFLNV